MMIQTLDQKLADLKAAAQLQTTAYQTSRNQLHQAVIDAYLWWREADAQTGYLDAAYKAAGIDVRKRKNANSPNFYPLVRLIWNMDVDKQAGTISNWAKSIAALHNEFTSNTQLYSKKPRDGLINFVKDSGGLGALRGEKLMSRAELEAEEAGGDLSASSTGTANGGKGVAVSADVAERKLHAAEQLPSRATIPHFPTAVTNNSQLLVMVGRRNASGQIEVIGSNYDDDLIKSALVACTQLDRSAVTPSLRLIAEALEPHALPAKLEKYRKKYFDDSTVTRTLQLKTTDADGKPKTRKQKVKQATRLRYRPAHGDFLVSKCLTAASVVSYVKPKKAFACPAEVILNGADRSWIERDLLNQERLSLYRASPDFGLSPSTTRPKAQFELAVENATAAHHRTLHFDAKSAVPVETNQQCAVANPAALKWDWQLDVTVQWLAEFDALCASPQINKIRGSFNDPRFATISMEVDAVGINLHYWWEEETSSYAETNSLPYGKHATLRATTQPARFTANSKDFAAIFAVLPSLPITSSGVVMEGNANVLRLSYGTDLADYCTYIPAADITGKRDETVFELYGA